MSQYYNAKKIRGLYVQGAPFPFRISRSKVDLFLNCPRCFYLDVRLGVGQPPGYPFNLNSAVDKLLKKEFDLHRAKGQQHPLMKAYDLDVVPLAHQKIDEWRNALSGGITFLHKATNFLLTGGIDDVWVNQQGEFIIVDYKATAKESEVSIDAAWQIGYKRQMEFYQWLFRQNNYPVAKVGYFVYCNGITDKEAFDAKLEFDIKLIPYNGDDSWVEPTVLDIHHCLNSQQIPQPGQDCDFCKYRQATKDVEKSVAN